MLPAASEWPGDAISMKKSSRGNASKVSHTNGSRASRRKKSIQVVVAVVVVVVVVVVVSGLAIVVIVVVGSSLQIAND